jgi:hypothetical protein
MGDEIDFKNYVNLELDPSVAPCDFCALDDNHLLLTNYKERKLVLFDKNLKQIKKINKIETNDGIDETVNERIDTENLGSVCIDINETRDFIYISDYNNHKVFKCDLNYKFVKVTEGQTETNSKFKHPFGIAFHQDFIYVCDCSNKRIQKLNANSLDFGALYDLDYKPWRIKIGNNIVCVRATITKPSINFYDLNTFQLLTRYEDRNGIVGFFNSRFYEFFGPTKKIYVYNSTSGKLENEIETDGLGMGNLTSRNGAFIKFNDNIILGSHDSQKLCLIKI